MEPISIYVHIPMCVKKCAYCDFTSFCGRMKQREAYTEAVCREMREQAAFFGARRVNTVFFGGGTPTLMTGAQMERMMDTLRACFDLAADAEVTMEGNPGTLTRENLDAYRKAGVNRLSLGVQSLDDGLLQSIGRIHTNEQARQAVAKGYYLSFGERTFASRKTLEALREVPSDRLFFETDDSPAAIETIYARAAEVRRTTVEELRRATAENYRRLFGEK